MILILRLLLVFSLSMSFGIGVTQAAQEESPPCDTVSEAIYFVGLGEAYFASKAYNDAILAFSCGLALDDTLVPAYVTRGFARSIQGDEPGALEDFNSAIALDETSIDAYVSRGTLYMRQGNFALAIGDLTVALALEPDNVSALQNRAVVHAAEFNYDLAMDDLMLALMIAPDDPALHAAVGAVYLALAAQSYGQFRALAGDNVAIPGGAPSSLYLAIERSALTGNYGDWVALLRPAGE